MKSIGLLLWDTYALLVSFENIMGYTQDRSIYGVTLFYV